MPETFLTSCSHFGHQNIIKFQKEYRPFSDILKHDAALIDNWNSVVSENDTVIHLGDVAFTLEAYKSCVPLLNGRKKLVLGNHDTFSMRNYMHDFEQISGPFKIAKGWWVSHIPVHPSEFGRTTTNIHGHTHDRLIADEYGDLDERYVNVCVEQWDLTPVPFDLIKSMRR